MSTEPNGNNTKKIEVGIGKALPRELEKLAVEMKISPDRSCEILLEDFLGLTSHSERPEKK
jgi:hypothetical protein